MRFNTVNYTNNAEKTLHHIKHIDTEVIAYISHMESFTALMPGY